MTDFTNAAKDLRTAAESWEALGAAETAAEFRAAADHLEAPTVVIDETATQVMARRVFGHSNQESDANRPFLDMVWERNAETRRQLAEGMLEALNAARRAQNADEEDA
jgi:hypothetical protein